MEDGQRLLNQKNSTTLNFTGHFFNKSHIASLFGFQFNRIGNIFVFLCKRHAMKTLPLFFTLITGLIAYSQQPLPTETSTLFSGSGVCESCHIAGTGVLTTQTGRDISPLTLWRSTMMANASKDPLWQAKVSAESIENPALQAIIETKCTSCHAPLGKTEAFHLGATSFLLSEATEDPLSMDGVSCTLCHQVRSEGLYHDSTFTANFPLDDSHEIFGPYQNPVAQPMFNQTGFNPVYSEHIGESRLCATCHTLFTPYLDNQGNVAGTFPEQTPFLEWRNSSYVDDKSCQQCHMPAVNEEMLLSVSPPWLSELRSPVYEHELTGGNAFMIRMLKENSNELQIAASPLHLDSTISKSINTLQSAVELSMENLVSDDSLRLSVMLKNVSGHKFPTGFPSRRAWVYLRVENNTGSVIFESGDWDENGIILDGALSWQQHHNTINDDSKVQIYQALMKDVDDNLTYILLRGAAYLKDNRIPPTGYIPGGPDDDNIAIHGFAEADVDFNRFSNGNHGSGADIISYSIPLNNETEFDVTVKVCYQTIDPHFAQNLSEYDTPQANTFENMYNQASNEPEIIAEISEAIQITGIERQNDRSLNIIPNPTSGSAIIISGEVNLYEGNISVFSLSGEEQIIYTKNKNTIDLHDLSSGIYIYRFCDHGEIYTGKIIKK